MGVITSNSVLGEAADCKLKDITNGTSNTLLVFELECEVERANPQGYPAVNDSNFGDLSVACNQMLPVLMADSEVSDSTEATASCCKSS